jgi:hypothetical protein
VDLSGLSPGERRQLAAALRNGDRVRWNVPDPAPRGVRLDEIAVLCQELRAADPQLEERLSSLLPPGPRPGPLPEVTAVIPCNRQDVVGLRALLAQDCELRVLVLSNGDGPEGLPGAQVVRVDWEGHGATRQAAVDRVSTRYLLFTVDDAIPLGAGSVRQLVDALEAGGWDAVIGRQVPWPDADPVTAERVRRWTPPPSVTTSTRSTGLRPCGAGRCRLCRSAKTWPGAAAGGSAMCRWPRSCTATRVSRWRCTSAPATSTSR